MSTVSRCSDTAKIGEDNAPVNMSRGRSGPFVAKLARASPTFGDDDLLEVPRVTKVRRPLMLDRSGKIREPKEGRLRFLMTVSRANLVTSSLFQITLWQGHAVSASTKKRRKQKMF
jgi:hypothetical protein